MTFAEYQQFTGTTNKMPELWYHALGLAGEAGEVANKIKKVYRDNNGKITEQKFVEIKEELGDVLWYLTMLAHLIGTNLEEVAIRNKAKLEARHLANKIKGDGDQR